MKHTRRVASTVLALLAGAALSGCTPRPARTSRLLVTGEADSRAQPDTAVVVLSVVTQNQRALIAQQENARKSDAVMQAVREVAGATPELQTSDYSLQPQRDYGSQMPKIVGYEARNTVTVRTGQLDSVGAVIDAATRAGANSVESVAFILRESNPARGQTLAEATRQAMTKAHAMAEAMGGRIVRVVEEQEGGFANRPTTVDQPEANASASMNTNTATYADAVRVAPRTPVESGPLNVRSQVQLVVEVEAPLGQ